MKRVAGIAALALAACSQSEAPEDVPTLPPQTAETANQLMREAEKAAARAETTQPAARSAPDNKQEDRQ